MAARNIHSTPFLLHEQCVDEFLCDGSIILNKRQMIGAQVKRPTASSSKREGIRPVADLEGWERK